MHILGPRPRFGQFKVCNLSSYDGISFAASDQNALTSTELAQHNTKWLFLHNFCPFLRAMPYFSPQRSIFVHSKTVIPFNVLFEHIFQVLACHLRIPWQYGSHCETHWVGQNHIFGTFLHKFAYLCPEISVFDNLKCKLPLSDCPKKPNTFWISNIDLLEDQLLQKQK